jgi:hypothetical protein
MPQKIRQVTIETLDADEQCSLRCNYLTRKMDGEVKCQFICLLDGCALAYSPNTVFRSGSCRRSVKEQL